MEASRGGMRASRASLVTFARTNRFRWILVASFMVMLAAVRAGSPDERDPYWGARAGWENLTGTPLAREDTWSWAADGVWYPNSPLWNMLLGAMWHSLGYWGFFWLAFVSMLVYFWLAWRIAILLGARPLPGLLGMAVPLAFSLPMLSARATLVIQSLILASVLFAYTWGLRALNSSTVLDGVVVAGVGVVLSVVGNWVHLSFLPLSAAIAVMWAVSWWLVPGLGTIRRTTMTVTGTTALVLGSVLSPFGIAATVERSRVVRETCRGLILEWASILEVQQVQWYVAACVALAVVVATAAWIVHLLRGEGWGERRLRLVVPLFLLGAPAALAGLVMVRFLGLSLLCMAPIAAAMFTLLANGIHKRTASASTGFWARPRAAEYTSGKYWTVVLTAVGILLVPGAVHLAAKGARPPELAVIQQLPANCASVTDGSIAGPLILARPDVKVWIDGRADFYGRDHLVEVYRFYLGAPAPTGATCAVLPVTSWREPMAAPQAMLDADPAWERVAEENGFILWVREPAS